MPDERTTAVAKEGACEGVRERHARMVEVKRLAAEKRRQDVGQ